MFDEKTILARLQNGENAQTIADEMAAMINNANKAYAELKAAEETEKAQAEAVMIQKKEELQEIIDLFADWCSAYYGVGEEAWVEINADTVLELFDSLQEYVKAMNDLTAVFGAKKPAVKVVKTQSADDTLNAFLNKMGW